MIGRASGRHTHTLEVVQLVIFFRLQKDVNQHRETPEYHETPRVELATRLL